MEYWKHFEAGYGKSSTSCSMLELTKQLEVWEKDNPNHIPTGRQIFCTEPPTKDQGSSRLYLAIEYEPR
jgi:hypothetical protein